MSFEDSYVVRIYRRERGSGTGRRSHDRVALTGTVEHADTGAHWAFHDVEELWAALAQAGKAAPKRRRRQT